MGSERRGEGQLPDGNDGSITHVRDLLCCQLIYRRTQKGDKTTGYMVRD